MAKDEITVEGLQESPSGMKLRRIAEILNAECVRSEDTAISDIATLSSAKPEDISFVASKEAAAEALESEAGAFLVSGEFDVPDKPVVRVKEVWTAVSALMNIFRPAPTLPDGIDPTARVGHSADLSPGVKVGAYAVIGNGVSIGKGSSVGRGATVGDGTVIGEDCLIYAGVHIYHNIQIGDRVVLHSGAVIGAEGFKAIQVEGKLLRVPQAGTVVLENDVEIGANTTVDRAFLDETRIGAGTKVDNQVQIAHNVRIGKECAIAAQVGIAGSATLGDNCMVGGRAAFIDNVVVGNNVMVGGGAGVNRDVSDGQLVWGVPAVPFKEWAREYAHYRRLPETMKKIKLMGKRIQELEEGK